MKKVLLLLASLTLFTPRLYSISVNEYIDQYGMPKAYNNDLGFGKGRLLGPKILVGEGLHTRSVGKGVLTDLTGLQRIPNRDYVRQLDLSDHHLQTVPAGIFNGFSYLQSLDLSSNKLQELPVDAFNGLDNLLRFYLGHNQLKTLPSGIFTGLTKLEYLTLTDNQLQTLPADIFNGLSNLKGLWLDSNNLQTLPINIFDGLNNLRRLYLSGNPFNREFIPTLTAMIRRLPKLETLNDQPVDEALRKPPFGTLKGLTADYLMQNLTPEQIEELAVAGDPAFDLLPLTSQQKAAIIAKNIDAFRHRLHELPSEILDLLTLTPAQKAGIAAQQRQTGR